VHIHVSERERERERERENRKGDLQPHPLHNRPNTTSNEGCRKPESASS